MNSLELRKAYRTAGNLRSLNDLAKTANASYILHTGDFGFYDDTSLERIAEKYVIAIEHDRSRRLTKLGQNSETCRPVFSTHRWTDQTTDRRAASR